MFTNYLDLRLDNLNKIFFYQKNLKKLCFSITNFNFKIIVIDLRQSFFDVGQKGDDYENVCS